MCLSVLIRRFHILFLRMKMNLLKCKAAIVFEACTEAWHLQLRGMLKLIRDQSLDCFCVFFKSIQPWWTLFTVVFRRWFCLFYLKLYAFKQPLELCNNGDWFRMTRLLVVTIITVIHLSQIRFFTFHVVSYKMTNLDKIIE